MDFGKVHHKSGRYLGHIYTQFDEEPMRYGKVPTKFIDGKLVLAINFLVIFARKLESRA